MAAKRQSLSGLSDRLQRKPAADVTPEPAATDTAQSAKRGSSQPDGRKGILVRARPEAWKSLKLIALDEGMTLQTLMVQAINDVLTKHGRPPVA